MLSKPTRPEKNISSRQGQYQERLDPILAIRYLLFIRQFVCYRGIGLADGKVVIQALQWPE